MSTSPDVSSGGQTDKSNKTDLDESSYKSKGQSMRVAIPLTPVITCSDAPFSAVQHQSQVQSRDVMLRPCVCQPVGCADSGFIPALHPQCCTLCHTCRSTPDPSRPLASVPMQALIKAKSLSMAFTKRFNKHMVSNHHRVCGLARHFGSARLPIRTFSEWHQEPEPLCFTRVALQKSSGLG